ncbi:site-specific integrase [Egicoccus halophilus]|uniref:Site-specific integrase n=1 Tax=Egicoccus halophilus TaxID=1670830 RepID=A0A8J3EQP0_9ACTN|nr:site-specific integrase [Egicoccus halophilus]GGI02822.1 site-specific integrase [Egicoccus halophilus]
MRGTIERYETKAGERLYRIRWDLPTGSDGRRRQRTRRGFRTKREASAALAELLHEQANRGRPSVRSTVTLDEYARGWLDQRRDLRPTARDNLTTALVHVLPRLGARRVQEVTPEDVATLYVDLAERGKRAGTCRTAGVTCAEHGCTPERHQGLSEKSVGHVHAALRAILAAAVEDGLIASNPADTKRAKQARARGGKTSAKVTEDRCWSTEQARAFIDATSEDRLGALWTTLLGTGLRRGEALALRWEDVDLDAGTLHVRRTVTAVRGQLVEADGGKTDAATRRIVLGDDLVALLRAHRARQVEERLAAGPAWQDTDAMFTEVDGRPLHPNKASTTFTRAAAAAGLPAIGVHGLRHTHATMLLRAGVPIPAVAQRLGHANPAITLAVYSHALPADDALAADATGRVLFA